MMKSRRSRSSSSGSLLTVSVSPIVMKMLRLLPLLLSASSFSSSRTSSLFSKTASVAFVASPPSSPRISWREGSAEGTVSPTTTTTTLRYGNNDVGGGGEGDAVSVIELNELHTMLRDAVGREDFMEAGRISSVMQSRLYDGGDGDDCNGSISEEERRRRRKSMSWKGLGAAPWLVDRLDALNYTFPTTIQINSMQAVNAILLDAARAATAESDDDSRRRHQMDMESTSLEERVDMVMKSGRGDDRDRHGDDDDDEENDSNNWDMGVVISGTTGSGKTLAFLVPLLSTLSDSLFNRQRIRVGDEERIGDTTGDLLNRVALVTSPVVRSSSRKQIMGDSRRQIAAGASMSTLGKSGADVKTPLALVVVPSRELGIQTAMLLYQLVGGNLKESPDAYHPGSKANSFKYKGPKGVRIACVLDDEEASFGLKLQTDVAITTPEYLGRLIDDGDIVPSKLRAVVYDEADIALEETKPNDLRRLVNDEDAVTEGAVQHVREYSRLTFLAGASVTESLGNLAVSSRMLPTGKSYIATATKHAALESVGDVAAVRNNGNEVNANIVVGSQPRTASLRDLDVCLYRGLRHERAIIKDDGGDSGLLLLTKLLRSELRKYERERDEQDAAFVNGSSKKNKRELRRPRVVVFFPSEEEARAAIEPLRDAVWGEHKLCVLLPKTGAGPLSIMDQFKRSETSVMLATPNSVRGLDFPALTHVYTLYLPLDDPREYVHLAGRVGRIGQPGATLGNGGRVISILRESDAPEMNSLAETLGFDFTDVDTSSLEGEELPRTGDGAVDTETADVESMRRYLEDTISLLDLADDAPAKSEADVAAARSGMEDDDDDEDDDEYDGGGDEIKAYQ